MRKKIINIFFLISIFVFIYFVSNYYFSEQNYVFTNKSRSYYSLNLNKIAEGLPTLKSDTDNIIFYKNDLEDFKNKRKKRAWERLIEKPK